LDSDFFHTKDEASAADTIPIRAEISFFFPL